MIRKTLLSLALSLAISGQAHATPDPNSAEYRNQWGLGAINVLPAWQAGATGQGVTIAVLDTGVHYNHFEFAGRIAPGGQDYITGDGDPFDDDADQGGHGSTMAGVIAAGFNNQGTVGIAYNARILPVRVVDSHRNPGHPATVNGLNFAANRPDVRVIVLAYGDTPTAEENQALINAANNGKILVASAGNEGKPNPKYPGSYFNQLNGAGIVVGATTRSGTLLPGTNRAGDLRNWFMVAPGEAIIGPGNATTTAFNTLTGTSVAAPHVAGAAALVLSLSPNLSNKEVVEILLSTATDLGAPGVDEVYGHGLLNVGRAVQPIGDTDSSSSSSGGGLGAAAAALAVGGGIAYWWNNKKAKEALEETLVFDSYDRPYIMDMTQALHVQSNRARLLDVMDMFDRQTRSMEIAVNDEVSLRLHASATNPSDYIFLKDADPFLEDWDEIEGRNLSYSLSGNLDNGIFFDLQSNQATASGFDRVGDLSISNHFVWGNNLAAPYLGFGSVADSMRLGYRINDRYAMSVAANRVDDDAQEFGTSSQATIIEGHYSPARNASLSLRLSDIVEDGSLLGGASGGVFSVDQAHTTALGLSGQYRLLDRLTLFANYTHGFTSVDEQQGSFLQEFGGLQSHAYGVGLLSNDVFRSHDRAGIAVSSPLRVRRGDVDLVVPHSVDTAGNLGTSRTRVDLSPGEAELDLEAFYSLSLNRQIDLGTHITWRDNPDGNPDVAHDVAVFGTLGLRF